jgi:hypothetical protein
MYKLSVLFFVFITLSMNDLNTPIHHRNTNSTNNITVVAVIDTGYKKTDNIKRCNSGDKDFTGNGMEDTNGHGSNVNYIINNEATASSYCVINVKFYKDTKNPHDNLNRLIEALRYLNSIKVDIVNISAGGVFSDLKEETEIKKLLDKGVKIVAAAGNENDILTKNRCNYFPACYDDRIIVVGAKNVLESNFGPIVDIFVDGYNLGPLNNKLSGTSQATARVTASLIK